MKVYGYQKIRPNDVALLFNKAFMRVATKDDFIMPNTR
jgi:hypothetical protein